MKHVRIFTVSFLIIFFIAVVSCNFGNTETRTVNDSAATDSTQHALLADTDWVAPDTSTLPHDATGDLIRYGRSLIASTGAYFGPRGKINHDANGMNCQNCHLDAGTRLYANSYSAVFSVYPKLRARSGTVENLTKRINDCMERSMNGKKLDSLSREMIAMKAYINWVGKDVKKGVTPKGASVVELPWLDRPADIDKGKAAFMIKCTKCHGENGAGKLNDDKITYQYPPLWGPHSYNSAAGLYRITRLGGFIKSNMPNLESTHDAPKLTNEEAWDIAAFICSMPRPEKKFSGDWPDITKKPVDNPFGPYADSYSETRHKYGPFTAMLPKGKK